MSICSKMIFSENKNHMALTYRFEVHGRVALLKFSQVLDHRLFRMFSFEFDFLNTIKLFEKIHEW